MKRFFVRLEFVPGSRYDGHVVEWVDDYSPRQAKRLRGYQRSGETTDLECGGRAFPVVIREVMEVDPREVGAAKFGGLPALVGLSVEGLRWNTR